MTPEQKALNAIEAELHHIHRDLVMLTNLINDIAGTIIEERGITAEEGEEEA